MMTYHKLEFNNTFSRTIIWESNVFVPKNALQNMGQVTEPRPLCYLALLSIGSKTRQQWRQPLLRDLTHIVCEKGAILSPPMVNTPMRINFSNSTQWNRISEDNWLVEAEQHFESWVFSLTSSNDSWQEQSRCGLRGTYSWQFNV